MVKLNLLGLPPRIESICHDIAEGLGRWIGRSIKWLDQISLHLQDWKVASGAIVLSNIAIFFMALEICKLAGRYLENEMPYKDLTEDERKYRCLGIAVVFLVTEIGANYAVNKIYRLPISAWKTVLISSLTCLFCIAIKLKC